MKNENSGKNAQVSLHDRKSGLLTTSGTLELYLLSVGKDTSWVLPQSLALGEVLLEQQSLKDHQIDWDGDKIPLVLLDKQANTTHALVIEGEQDQLYYAIATVEASVPCKVRISALRDIEPLLDKANTKADQFVSQYVTHDEKTWIVPDLEKLEKTFKKK
jgi:hypothetical protein